MISHVITSILHISIAFRDLEMTCKQCGATGGIEKGFTLTTDAHSLGGSMIKRTVPAGTGVVP